MCLSTCILPFACVCVCVCSVRYEDPGAVEGLAEALDTRLQVTAGVSINQCILNTFIIIIMQLFFVSHKCEKWDFFRKTYRKFLVWLTTIYFLDSLWTLSFWSALTLTVLGSENECFQLERKDFHVTNLKKKEKSAMKKYYNPMFLSHPDNPVKRLYIRDAIGAQYLLGFTFIPVRQVLPKTNTH